MLLHALRAHLRRRRSTAYSRAASMAAPAAVPAAVLRLSGAGSRASRAWPARTCSWRTPRRERPAGCPGGAPPARRSCRRLGEVAGASGECGRAGGRDGGGGGAGRRRNGGLRGRTAGGGHEPARAVAPGRGPPVLTDMLGGGVGFGVRLGAVSRSVPGAGTWRRGGGGVSLGWVLGAVHVRVRGAVTKRGSGAGTRGEGGVGEDDGGDEPIPPPLT